MLGFGGSRTDKSGRTRLGGRAMGEAEAEVEQALNRRNFETFLNILTTATDRPNQQTAGVVLQILSR
jgi:hypothetical protein